MSCECTYSDSPQVRRLQDRNSGQNLSEVWKTEATFVGYLASCSKAFLSPQEQFSFMKLYLSFQKPAARPMNNSAGTRVVWGDPPADGCPGKGAEQG